MVYNSKIYSRARGTQKIHLSGRGFGSVLLNTKIGGASALVNGPSPPDMDGSGMMSKMMSSMPRPKKIKNIVF
jgi:hypothetical protein